MSEIILSAKLSKGRTKMGQSSQNYQIFQKILFQGKKTQFANNSNLYIHPIISSNDANETTHETQYVIRLQNELQIQKEISKILLDFGRNLFESVKAILYSLKTFLLLYYVFLQGQWDLLLS